MTGPPQVRCARRPGLASGAQPMRARQGLLEVSGHAAGPPRVPGDDPDPGPRCSRRACPAGLGRSPGRAGDGGGAQGLIEVWIGDPDGIRIVLAEVSCRSPSAP